MSIIGPIVQAGEKLGLEGGTLNAWVKKHQEEVRNQRAAENEIRELERLKFEAETAKFKESKVLEEKKLEIEKEKIRENRELEEKTT